MNVEQERSRSPWMAVPPVRLGPLATELRCEVLVIGAGIAGLSTAYELAEEGRDVAVVDRGLFARGQSARTTAHLTFSCDDFYAELEKKVGAEGARAWYESQSAAVDRIEHICRQEGIDCDFARLDGFFVAADEKGARTLRDEVEAARRAGFHDVAWLDHGPPGFAASPAVRFPRQGRFHPMKYMHGLIRALGRHGVRMFDETPVTMVDETEDGVVVSCADGHRITADQVVVATNTPIHERVPVHNKQAPYRTYVVAFAAARGVVPDALVWDTLDPYHYVRLQPGDAFEDLVIVGGEDHKTGSVDDGLDRIQRLEAWARERFPDLGAVRYAWSGQVFEPADFVPYIGLSPDRHEVYLVTGDSGQGMTTGVAAGLVLRDLTSGRTSPWAALYDPSRKPVRALGAYVRENVTMVKNLAEHLLDRGPRDEDAPVFASADELEPGQGGLVRSGRDKLAAYRDPGGTLHVRSATCTHLGCVVHWNGFEGCWDCPCHGSQFSVDGEPLNGPAMRPLGAAERPAEAAGRRERAAAAPPAARP